MNNSLDKPSVNIVIDHDRVRKKGAEKDKAHIKVVVTFKLWVNGKKVWKQRPYKTGLFCTVADFARVMDEKDKRIPTALQDIRAKLNLLRVRANHIIEDLGVSDQQPFESYFLSSHSVEDIAGHFERKIEELLAVKPRPKISSAEKYGTALRSLQEFFGPGVVITFDMLTPEKLQEYEDWYTSQPVSKNPKKSVEKKSLTSVGINMRCLRHIFKRAIKKGIVSPTLFPFGVGLYVIPEGGDDTKKFLDKAEKDAFVAWRHSDDKWNELHDYALFSYYGFGMNLSDLARLKKNRVFAEYLTIDRQKTKGKKKKQKSTVIPLHPVMSDIIQRRGKKNLIPDDYVFPILEYSMDEEAIFYRIRNLVDDVNDMLAMIAKECNFSIKPTSYTLRHTFSFHFMQQGATTEELQDALAHGSKQTTENYKHGFTLGQKKKYSEGL